MQIDQVVTSERTVERIDIGFFSCSDWEFVWDSMNQECQEEITIIETNCLLETIENYLRKHK